MSGMKHDDYQEVAWICRSWWRWLNAIDGEGKPILIDNAEKSRDRAALAELRRLDLVDGDALPAVVDALSVPAFRRLIQLLLEAHTKQRLSNARLVRWLAKSSDRQSRDRRQFEPFIIAAATLAHIRKDCGDQKAKRGETARLLGSPRSEGAGKNDPLFAEARFKRLVRTRDDWPGLIGQARRISAILAREAPIGDLGASLILWNADPGIVRDWAFQYYGREFEPANPRDEDAATVNA